jgi:flagellar hook assembly protein FlgD
LVGADPQVVPPSQDVFSMQVYPNPFNPTTTFSFSLPQDATAEVAVFNAVGQRVKMLANEAFTAGMHKVVWEGRDDDNKAVSSGIYFYRLTTDGKIRATGKCVLLK